MNKFYLIIVSVIILSACKKSQQEKPADYTIASGTSVITITGTLNGEVINETHELKYCLTPESTGTSTVNTITTSSTTNTFYNISFERTSKKYMTDESYVIIGNNQISCVYNDVYYPNGKTDVINGLSGKYYRNMKNGTINNITIDITEYSIKNSSFDRNKDLLNIEFSGKTNVSYPNKTDAIYISGYFKDLKLLRK